VVKNDYFGFTMFLLLMVLVDILGFLCCIVGLLVAVPVTIARSRGLQRDCGLRSTNRGNALMAARGILIRAAGAALLLAGLWYFTPPEPGSASVDSAG